jgi:hypothetical protein
MSDLIASADHWEALAKSQDDMADWEESIGRPYGDTSSYRYRAQVYRTSARVLRLEAETGKPHCSMCLGDHPNHLHMHMG